jgi:glutamyl-tRNA synthetase
MHLGLARTALLGWLDARRAGGAFVVRMEDIDTPRIVAGAQARTLDDLHFLGLDWDEGPDTGGPYGPYVQSERYARYSEALEWLRTKGLVYPCSCTRREIAIASAPHGPSDYGPVYPGTCRDGPRRPEAPLALRFRVPAVLPAVSDLRLGPLTPSARGDFVVQRADGTVSYQLAVVVDDVAMHITDVVRGEDLAGCTGWQAALYDALDAARPRFLHVPLLLGADGKRLAKRDGAEPVATLRERGIPAARIVGALAASCGLVPRETDITPRDLLSGYAPERIVETEVDFSTLLRTDA